MLLVMVLQLILPLVSRKEKEGDPEFRLSEEQWSLMQHISSDLLDEA